jgi:hypothetical protein
MPIANMTSVSSIGRILDAVLSQIVNLRSCSLPNRCRLKLIKAQVSQYSTLHHTTSSVSLILTLSQFGPGEELRRGVVHRMLCKLESYIVLPLYVTVANSESMVRPL